MKSRVMAVLISGALLVGMLGGCSAPTESTSTETTTETAESDVTEEATEEVAEEVLKVAALFPGPVNDASFNQSSYTGLVESESEYGVEIAYSENVEAADMVSTMKNYCDMGYGLVILVGFDFADALAEVAPSYEDVSFAIINGEGDGDNISGYRFNTPETGFIAGALAGLITETNQVGIIAGEQFTHVEDGVIGFAAGAMYVNSEITEDDVYTAYLDSWTDTVKGQETALSYIEKGCDVITTNANAVGLGTIATCEENEIAAVGYITDQVEVAPDTVVASAIQDGGAVVKIIIESKLDDSLVPGLNLLGAADGVISYSDWYTYQGEEISQEVQDEMAAVYEAICDGSLLEAGILPVSAYDTAE